MHQRFPVRLRRRHLFSRLLASSLLAVAAALLSTTCLIAPVDAQVRIVEPDNTASVQSFLQRGVLLEKEAKWGEALSHYEDALRSIPGERHLKERADWSRMHYDLAKRYSDTSFRRSITALSGQEALDLYGEVLLKIETHYVREIDWQQLVQRGTRSLDVALSDHEFVENNLRAVPAERVRNAVQTLHAAVDRYAIKSRRDAMSVVAIAGQTLQRDLGLRPAAAILEYVSGAIGGLDTYSTFLTGDQLREVYAQIDGSFVGLGIELKADNGSLLLVAVISGSPAHRAGIRAGDRILEVDGQSTTNVSTEKAAALLQGVEHSMVDLLVSSSGQPARRLRVRREHVDVPSIDDARILDPANGVAYLKMVSFQRDTSRDLESALWSLYHKGMKSLIVDVRGNPGGLLSASVDVSDKFVYQGKIVSTRGRSRQEDYDYSAHRSNTWGVPLVVLIDGDSASASEIFAAAIADHQRGTIVGVRSYGKGSVQGIFPLTHAGAGLRLTTAKFYGPSGRPISGAGVSPSVEVQETRKPSPSLVSTGTADDRMLQAAIQAARRQPPPR